MQKLWMCLICKINGTLKGHKMSQEEEQKELQEWEEYIASLYDEEIENNKKDEHEYL